MITTKGKAATQCNLLLLIYCSPFRPSPSAWAGQLSTFTFQFAIRLKQLVVPKAVNAAVRMDTTTWMMFRQRSLFFINSRPSLSFGHLPRGGCKCCYRHLRPCSLEYLWHDADGSSWSSHAGLSPVLLLQHHQSADDIACGSDRLEN